MNARGTRRPGRRVGKAGRNFNIRQSVIPPLGPPAAPPPAGCVVLAVAAIGVSGLIGTATIAAASLL